MLIRPTHRAEQGFVRLFADPGLHQLVVDLEAVVARTQLTDRERVLYAIVSDLQMGVG